MDSMKSEAASPSFSGSPAPSPLPTGGYTDYILRSSAPSSSTGWRHNIMKFVALGDRTVDPSSDAFLKPVKLNRKDPRTVRRLTDEEREQISRAALGPDAEVKEEDVKPEAPVKKEREEIDMSLVGTGTSGLAPSVRSKATMFKKKTKQVFVSSEEARRLKREEWMPWVLEGDDGGERWIGRLEGGTGESAAGANGAKTSAAEKTAKADRNGTGMKGWRPPAAPSEAGGGGSSYVAFVFGANGDDFKVVPVNRWYKFSKGPKYVTLGTDEAEDEWNKQQKMENPERWIMHRRANAAAGTSSGTSTPIPTPTASSKGKGKAKAAPPPAPSNIRSRLLDKSVLSSARAAPVKGPGRPMISVIKGSAGENGDDQMSGKKGKSGGREMEQDDDEFDYEEDFQDDEEGIAKIDDLADEEETKELEERIKKEMRGANRPDAIADDDDDDEFQELTNTGKEVKKLVRKSDKSALYESDGDESDNPYASSEYDEEGSVASADNEATRTSTPSAAPHRSSDPTRRHSITSSHRNSHSSRPSNSNSRAGSRGGSPALGTSGSAHVAKRATSPNASSRRSAPGSRVGSPAPGGKRKRTEGEEVDAAKRRKNGETPPPVSEGDADLITEADLVALFRTKASFTTKEVLSHFKKAFKADPRNKMAVGKLIQAVATFVEGELVLKPGL